MLDREGFRPNVGIVLLNSRNQVFWGKRLRTHSWQFPQGGINHGESPEQAMFRELHEEVGLLPDHVQIVARTRDWLRYEVPDHFIRKDARGHYRGQKQIWFRAPGRRRTGKRAFEKLIPKALGMLGMKSYDCSAASTARKANLKDVSGNPLNPSDAIGAILTTPTNAHSCK